MPFFSNYTRGLSSQAPGKKSNILDAILRPVTVASVIVLSRPYVKPPEYLAEFTPSAGPCRAPGGPLNIFA